MCSLIGENCWPVLVASSSSPDSEVLAEGGGRQRPIFGLSVAEAADVSTDSHSSAADVVAESDRALVSFLLLSAVSTSMGSSEFFFKESRKLWYFSQSFFISLFFFFLLLLFSLFSATVIFS